MLNTNNQTPPIICTQRESSDSDPCERKKREPAESNASKITRDPADTSGPQPKRRCLVNPRNPPPQTNTPVIASEVPIKAGRLSHNEIETNRVAMDGLKASAYQALTQKTNYPDPVKVPCFAFCEGPDPSEQYAKDLSLAFFTNPLQNSLPSNGHLMIFVGSYCYGKLSSAIKNNIRLYCKEQNFFKNSAENRFFKDLNFGNLQHALIKKELPKDAINTVIGYFYQRLTLKEEKDNMIQKIKGNSLSTLTPEGCYQILLMGQSFPWGPVFPETSQQALTPRACSSSGRSDHPQSNINSTTRNQITPTAVSPAASTRQPISNDLAKNIIETVMQNNYVHVISETHFNFTQSFRQTSIYKYFSSPQHPIDIQHNNQFSKILVYCYHQLFNEIKNNLKRALQDQKNPEDKDAQRYLVLVYHIFTLKVPDDAFQKVINYFLSNTNDMNNKLRLLLKLAERSTKTSVDSYKTEILNRQFSWKLMEQPPQLVKPLPPDVIDLIDQ